jgi:hypothetical protein
LLNPATNPAIIAAMRDEWFPFVTKQVKAKHGWDTFYYGNTGGGPGIGGGGRGAGAPPGAAGAARAGGAAGAAGGGGGRGGTPRPCAPPETPTPTGAHSAVPTPPASTEPTRGWMSFESLPRYHNSYVGMRNRFALLSEAYAYATFEDRIKATNYFMEESLNFAMQNADRLRKIMADADRESIAGKDVSTRANIKVEGTVEILMGEVEDELNPNNSACMNRRKDVLKAEIMRNGLWFAPTATETAEPMLRARLGREGPRAPARA